MKRENHELVSNLNRQHLCIVETLRERKHTVINDSSALRDTFASSSHVADLELMSCNKTWPSTPEIGPLDMMICSFQLN